MLKYGTGILICVILPMTVYVIDILITVNVIESKDYKNALNHWQDDTNADNKPIPTMNATGYNEYKLKETWFYEVRIFLKFDLTLTLISSQMSPLFHLKFHSIFNVTFIITLILPLISL